MQPYNVAQAHVMIKLNIMSHDGICFLYVEYRTIWILFSAPVFSFLYLAVETNQLVSSCIY